MEEILREMVRYSKKPLFPLQPSLRSSLTAHTQKMLTTHVPPSAGTAVNSQKAGTTPSRKRKQTPTPPKTPRPRHPTVNTTTTPAHRPPTTTP